MDRIFDNLFKNAFNYCYENTTVLVDLEVDHNQEEVVLTVENEGKTIPKEKLEHLFEQFITLHFGMITCESENEKIKFIIRLPY